MNYGCHNLVDFNCVFKHRRWRNIRTVHRQTSSVDHLRKFYHPVSFRSITYTDLARVVARDQNFNLTCLGYGGQCHLDSMVARMIRDLPANFISMCLGINIQGASSLGPRAFVLRLSVQSRLFARNIQIFLSS